MMVLDAIEGVSASLPGENGNHNRSNSVVTEYVPPFLQLCCFFSFPVMILDSGPMPTA
jgi:hypothetical protein